jgi:hypothetical protein
MGLSMIEQNKRKYLLNTLITFALAAFLIGVIRDMDAWFRPQLVGATRISYSLIAVSVYIVTFTGLVLLETWLPNILLPIRRYRAKLGWLRWMLAGAIGLLGSTFFLISYSQIFSGGYLRWFLALTIYGAAAWTTTVDEKKSIDFNSLIISLIVTGTMFSLGESFQSAVNYPFSLGWSEGNRIWDYSVLYGRRLYIFPADQNIPAYIDKGRQSLWGLPFLLPQVSIGMVRFWSAFVFSIPYILLGWLLFFSPKQKSWDWVFLGFWAYLFLNQGPIYTPLILSAILVAGARRLSTWMAIVLVALAGYYAVISRSTWMFAPAMWAGMITLVEGRFGYTLNDRQRWTRAISLVAAGLTGSLFIPRLIKLLKASSPSTASPSMLSVEGVSNLLGRQPLLWERLFPNATNSLGIVMMLLLAAGPLMALLIYLVVVKKWKLDIWQILALAGGLIAFLVVGIVVSVKIGGGNNLHNLDMLLIGLLFTAALAWQAGAKEWLTKSLPWNFWVNGLILLTVLYPAVNVVLAAEPFSLPSKVETQQALETVQEWVAKGNAEGEVLFIDQRQLLTFGYVKDVPLVPAYEKKRMMDEAMADNSAYFEKFNRDLKEHRFSMIVSEPLQVKFQGGTYEFGNENDAWVKWISIPVLCYYEPVETLPVFGTQILVPKEPSPPQDGISCP